MGKKEVGLGAPKHQQRAGTIRRVVRVAGQFVCGICRQSYEELPAAYGCLDRCWQEFLSLDAVIMRTQGGTPSYRCRICARDYAHREQAQSCAAQCKERMRRKAVLEDKLTTKEENIPKRTPLRLVQAVRLAAKQAVPVRKTPPPKMIPAEPDIQRPAPELIGVITADANERAVEPAVLLPEGVEEAAKPKKKKPSAIFYRDNAKYACTVCNERYFTKVEVTKCYESHE